MNKIAVALMVYLENFLEAHPESLKEIVALHREQTGRPLDHKAIWQHKTRNKSPHFATGLVYISYLRHRGHLTPSRKAGQLFTVKNPEWLKEKI